MYPLVGGREHAATVEIDKVDDHPFCRGRKHRPPVSTERVQLGDRPVTIADPQDPFGHRKRRWSTFCGPQVSNLVRLEDVNGAPCLGRHVDAARNRTGCDSIGTRLERKRHLNLAIPHDGEVACALVGNIHAAFRQREG